MTVALWIGTMAATIVITIVVFGAAVRSYVAALIIESREWQRRAEAAESEIEAHLATEVRLVPLDPQDDLDVFLKGMPGLEGME